MNLRNGKLAKLTYKIAIFYLKIVKLRSEARWKLAYKKLLKKYGMDINMDNNGYIDPSVYFDNYDYTKIHIGSNVTISREVLLLLHDWSITAGLISKGVAEGGVLLKRYCY